MRSRRPLLFATAALLALTTLTSSASPGRDGSPSRPDAEGATRADIVHLLGRLGFGPRPGQAEDVQRLGLDVWIDRQLQPERLDDAALEGRLSGLRTLGLGADELITRFYRPAFELRRRVQRAGGNASPAAGDAPTPGELQDMAAADDAGMREQARAAARARVEAARAALTPAEQQQLAEAARGVRDAQADLAAQKILRATYSTRQLQEVLVDFWFNHFNVFAGKPLVQPFVPSFERDVIRPHVFGSFRDLLGAVAASPAMLLYLDNWQSSARGLNENYARELLELHTLGVDGGYTQADIGQVARAFTGWTVRQPRAGGGFVFNPRMHDAGSKRVLGLTLPAGGGREDGERVLDLLARHPATATFIATKLARRFVADDPPAALVARLADTFRRTDGNLRAVARTLAISPELRAEAARGAKVKSPFEYVVSALRATGAEVRDTRLLARQLRALGQPLYFAQPPTGYPEHGERWVSTGTLLARMNTAMAFASGRVPGVRVPPLAADVASARRLVEDELLHGEASDATLATLQRATTPADVLALGLGAPEFQRR